MVPTKTCKTVHQYNKIPIANGDMKKLLEIAEDYSRVKNYVYQRYGSIRSLSKLYPGYTVQNEMTESGLRSQLGLPSVYFYLAVFEALGDIKTQWSKMKNSMLTAIAENPRFTPEDRHYLRFVLKVGGCLEGILIGAPVRVPENMQEQYRGVMEAVDAGNLNRYLCRQVRKRLHPLHTEKARGFAVTERAYRYGTQGEIHGIFLSTKENRKRIFVPLTDENEYKKQLYIKLKPEKNSLEIDVPLEITVQSHRDYTREIGLSPGIWQMYTTDQGKAYGERFGELHQELADLMRTGESTYRREKANNPGREKYLRRKHKLNARLEAYINQEINRLLAEEKPAKIYLPRLPGNSPAGKNHKINYSVAVWRKGYIRKRLEQKCLENGIELLEVLGKGIGIECSKCGAEGVCLRQRFYCAHCGYEIDKKVNAAQNALKRGRAGREPEQRELSL